MTVLLSDILSPLNPEILTEKSLLVIEKLHFVCGTFYFEPPYIMEETRTASVVTSLRVLYRSYRAPGPHKDFVGKVTNQQRIAVFGNEDSNFHIRSVLRLDAERISDHFEAKTHKS